MTELLTEAKGLIRYDKKVEAVCGLDLAMYQGEICCERDAVEQGLRRGASDTNGQY
jgi:hypothetical protein